ncbi:hypothetical protein [Dolichospermum circinale]|jgi:hypothetical protein|uniref:hypothetical protein n=1 Tax=Dolichospermum circinale TaxID=109265 RepID=UPI00232CD2C5|nr:hypothetical protein [Dolichospermum circinale]MDB9449968.1 hypothetical protein [Dolichospermum circinale CS-547]
MREGGNPELKKYQYKCQIADTKGELLGIKVAPGVKKQLLEKFGKKYTDKVREAIAKLLEE